jgi:hypothetical protein
LYHLVSQWIRNVISKLWTVWLCREISTLQKSLQHTLNIFSLLCLYQSFPGNSF